MPTTTPAPEDEAPLLPEGGPRSGPALPWVRRTFASFAVPNYRWFFFGQGTSLIGSWVRSTAQGWLVYLLTGSRMDLGTVAALGQLPLLVSPLTGAVADRMDKRRLLQGLAAFAMLISLALAALTGYGAVRPWHVMVLAALSGLEMAFELPCRQSYVVEMVGRGHLRNAIALNSAMFNSARMIGPAVAGLLMASLGGDAEGAAPMRGIAACFLLDGLSFVAVIFALQRIRDGRGSPAAPAGGWREEVLAGFRYVRGDLRARTLLVLLCISVVFGWSYLALMPAFARDVLGLGERGFGLLLSANGVGAAAGALWVAGRRDAPTRLALRRRVFGCLLLFAAMVVVFSRMRSFAGAAAVLSVAGFGAVAFVSTGNSLIQLQVPDRLRGRVMGIWALAFGGSMPVGSLLLGAVAEATDTPTAMAASGSACLVLSGIVWLRLPPASGPDAAG